MERLTRVLTKTVVYTKGKYDDTTSAEMTTGDVRTVLKKLAEYEDIGTPMELKQLKENGGFTSLELAEIATALKKLQMVMSSAADIIDNWKSDYEELKKIKERNIPQKPTLEGDGYAPDGSFIWDTWLCPNCGSAHEVDDEKYDYCPNCGQKIDWREDDAEWKVE